jgi:Tol biopolymer transport system component
VLLTRLVNDVGDNPDQLSILQHALNRTWARWQNVEGDKGPLDLAHYEAIGTMAHALDQHADRAYAELATTRQQRICEKLFKALTDKATDPRGVRRPTTLGTLCALTDATAAEVTDVIDVFRKPSRSFLMPPAGEAFKAETVIDISHESLMRVWQRLIKWADEEARSAQTYRRLADTADLHAAGNANLWRDPELQFALVWREKNQPNETWASRYHPGFASAMGFLAESSEAREAERAEREQQRQREREAQRKQEKAEVQARYARRMRLAAWFSASLALFAVGFAVTAYKAKQAAEVAKQAAEVANLDAQKQKERADNELHRAQTTEALYLASLARQRRTTGDAGTAILLALEALDIATGTTRRNAPEVVLQLDGAWRALRERLILEGHEGRVETVAFSPDGKRIVTASADKTARLWDADTGKQIGAPLKGHAAHVLSAAFSPDGKRIVTGSGDNTARLWDADTGKQISDPLKGHQDRVWSVAFSPDGKRIVTGSWDNTARLWDADTGKEVGKLEGHQGHVTHAAFSPDGKRIVTASADKTARLWDAETGKPIGPPLRGHEGA